MEVHPPVLCKLEGDVTVTIDDCQGTILSVQMKIYVSKYLFNCFHTLLLSGKMIYTFLLDLASKRSYTLSQIKEMSILYRVLKNK